MKPFLLAVAKRLVLVTLDEAMRRSLPVIFKRLDSKLPLLFTNNAPPSFVRGAIASTISEVTKRRATADQVEAIVALYDPVAAARNHLISQR